MTNCLIEETLELRTTDWKGKGWELDGEMLAKDIMFQLHKVNKT